MQLGSGVSVAVTALTQPLVWEFPYAAGVPIKKKQKQKQKKNKKKLTSHITDKDLVFRV